MSWGSGGPWLHVCPGGGGVWKKNAAHPPLRIISGTALSYKQGCVSINYVHAHSKSNVLRRFLKRLSGGDAFTLRGRSFHRDEPAVAFSAGQLPVNCSEPREGGHRFLLLLSLFCSERCLLGTRLFVPRPAVLQVLLRAILVYHALAA